MGSSSYPKGPAVFRITVDNKKTVKYLAGIIFFLLIINLVNIVVQHTKPEETLSTWFLDRFFNFNLENNFPAFFSTLLLLYASIILFVIYAQTKSTSSGKGKKGWFVLGCIFSFLAIDENIQIHEISSDFVRPMLANDLAGLLHWAWVIPYFLFFLAVAVYLFRFVIALPAVTRTLFFLSAFLFVSGAIGLELLEGYFFKKYGLNHIYNQLLYCVEELLEMTGIIIFIYALLHYLSSSCAALTVMFRNTTTHEPIQTQEKENSVVELSPERGDSTGF